MFKDHSPPPKPGTVAKARKLRRKMTLPEVLLWRIMRTRPLGLKFRRQHGSDDFILDFYCGDARLGIEVDGIAHNMGRTPERDVARDAFFAAAGIETLRIPATEVLRDAERAMESIVMAAQARLLHHHPAAPGGHPSTTGQVPGGPPPRDKLGEE
jgi:very-short-patch-repair endonuclease